MKISTMKKLRSTGNQIIDALSPLKSSVSALGLRANPQGRVLAMTALSDSSHCPCELKDRNQPKTDFQMPTSALQRLLSVMPVTLNSGFTQIPVVPRIAAANPQRKLWGE